MSMPTITTSPNPISMSQAITDLIESIALEETALSHIPVSYTHLDVYKRQVRRYGLAPA